MLSDRLVALHILIYVAMQRYLILAALLAVSSLSFAQKGEKAINPTQMVRDILALEADSMQGRLPCSLGEKRTVSYLTSRMQQLGLKPAFGSSFTQPVPLATIQSKLPKHVSISTPKGEIPLYAGDDFTLWSPTTQPHVQINGSPIVFVGFGVTAPENEWDDFAGIDVRGKTIIVLVNDPGFYNNDTSLFKGKAMTYYGRWRYKFEEAERRGAKACLIIHDEAGAGYPWSVVNTHTNGKEFYIDDASLANPSCVATGWITKNAAQKMLSASGYRLNELMDAAAKRGFKAVDLASTFSVDIENVLSKGVSHNVGGYIRGTKFPNEVVVYTGHWDHLGFGKPVAGDSICHGASDNASAIAWMFAIAEAFRNAPAPERSVLFLSPTGEEAGLLGSSYYVQHPTFEMRNTVALFNTDVFVFLGRFKDITVTGPGHSELDRMLEIEAASQGRYLAADPTPENGMFYRSDQQPFLKASVPALFAKGYIEAVELGKEKTAIANADYWKSIYHKPTDRFKIGLHKIDGVYEDAVLFYRLGSKLANSRVFPKWSKSSEFYVER